MTRRGRRGIAAPIVLSALAAAVPAAAQTVDRVSAAEGPSEWYLIVRHAREDLVIPAAEAGLRVGEEGGEAHPVPLSVLRGWATSQAAQPHEGEPLEIIEGGQIRRKLSEPPQETAEPEDEEPRDALFEDPLVAALIATTAMLLLSLVGVLLYFKTIRPRRLRRPLLAALEIIERDDEPRFEEAEGLISGALGTGLNASDVDEARFALAYVRARLGRPSEALSPLRELITIGKAGLDARYFYLWLNARQKNEDEVIRIYEEHREELRDYRDTRRIASIAYLRHARARWGRKQIEAALASYDEVRRLGVLADEIPPGASNHHLVFGIDAVVQKQYDEARRHFEAALAEAGKSKQQKLEAEAALLMAEWLEEKVDDLDERLAGLVERCRKALPKDRQRHHTVDEPESWQPSEHALLYCNLVLWWTLAWTETRAAEPAGSGLLDEAWEDLRARTERVIEEDPTRGDAWLIGGLIAYYFSEHDPERRAEAIQRLDKALECGVSVPEVVNLCNHEKRLAEIDEQELFFKTLAGHLNDATVSDRQRERLIEELSRYEGMRQRLANVFLDPGIDAPSPISSELRNRSQVLEQRLARMVKVLAARGKAPDEATTRRLKASVAELRRTGEQVGHELSLYEDAERLALVGTAEVLLPEEEGSLQDVEERT